MNVRLLRKVAKHIAEEPKRFIMGAIVQRKERPGDLVEESEEISAKREWKFPRCGTAACISGWAAILSNRKDIQWDTGREALGIDGPEAVRLFAVDRWPAPFGNNFVNAKSARGRVKAAVARIEHFIKTKGQE